MSREENRPQLPKDLTGEQLDAISAVWSAYMDAYEAHYIAKDLFIEDKENKDLKEEFRRAKVDLYVRRNAWRKKAQELGILNGIVST